MRSESSPFRFLVSFSDSSRKIQHCMKRPNDRSIATFWVIHKCSIDVKLNLVLVAMSWKLTPGGGVRLRSS